MQRDRKASAARFARRTGQQTECQPRETIEELERLYQTLSDLKNVPDVAAVGFQRKDAAGTMIRWHLARHRKSDGKIPVLDFVSCHFHNKGRMIKMRNGTLVARGHKDRKRGQIAAGFSCANRISDTAFG